MSLSTTASARQAKPDQSTSKATREITAIVPCYNESESIPQLSQNLRRLQEQSDQSYPNTDWKFIFVDDGSSDSTFSDLKSTFESWSNARVLRHDTNQGLIAALVTGFEACESEWVAVIDSDCTYDPQILIPMLQKAERENLQVVTASPYHPDGSVGNVPGWRIALSRCASQLYRWPMRNKLNCYTCCVRVYQTSWVKKCQPHTTGFVGVTELLWQLDHAGATIGEYPATLHPRTTGVSKMRTFRTMIRHFRLLGSILKQKCFG